MPRASSLPILVLLATLVALPTTAFAGVMNADLSITKTDGSATAIPGGSVVYTIVASNAGPFDVTGGTVADTFDPILTCTWTCVASAGSSCTASGIGDINDSVNLLNGGTATYTVTCGIASSATGNLVNTATVSSTLNDPNMADNSATDTDTLTPTADLSITKTDGAATAIPGGSVVYTIVASNAGPSDATGTTVADTFDPILTCTWTCAASAGSSCTASGAGNINDLGGILSGGSLTYTATCDIAADATGSLANTATVSASVLDPNGANNSATDTDTLVATADLSITKTDDVDSVTPGGSVVYTIVASNTGPSDVTGATVADTFDPILTCTWTCAASAGSSCTASGTGDINDSVDLLAGGAVTYMATCDIATDAAGTLANTATVSSAAADPNGGNDSATDTDDIEVVAGPSEIPTMGTFGQVVLVLFLLTAAFWALRRKRRVS
ncbi:MAG: DUF11 domain-containing protein [Acidobacteria bacterium]|nr:DUF11 domain-containing protein [Acidobacteriota bacterium]